MTFVTPNLSRNHQVSSLQRAGDLLPPFSVAYVKGYRRSVTALIVAEAVRCLNILDEVSENYKATLLRGCA